MFQCQQRTVRADTVIEHTMYNPVRSISQRSGPECDRRSADGATFKNGQMVHPAVGLWPEPDSPVAVLMSIQESITIKEKESPSLVSIVHASNIQDQEQASEHRESVTVSFDRCRVVKRPSGLLTSLNVYVLCHR